MMSPLARTTFGMFYALVILIIYLPIVVMAIFSFNSGKYQTMPFREATIAWYQQILVDSQYLEALGNSLVLASLVSVTATAIAFAAAYALVNAEMPGKELFTLFILAPLVVPLLLIGISLRLYFGALGIQPGLSLVFIGQVLFVLPLAVLNLRNRLAQLPRSHEEAARDLGASRLTAIIEVVIPACKFTMIATLLLTFTFAFDEFVIAYFLTNFEITLPIKIWTTLVTGFDPVINAVGVAVFLFSMTLGLLAQAVFMRKETA
ncbi:MAG: ABC transporter permease [Geminicoccales bacterium]